MKHALRQYLAQGTPDAPGLKRQLSVPGKLSRRLSKEQVTDLVARYDAGATGKQLAIDLGVSRSAVIDLLRAQGVELRRRRFTVDEQQRIVRLYQSGLSQVEIARIVQRDARSVWHVLRRNGSFGRKTRRETPR